jgi:hypothetical protein
MTSDLFLAGLPESGKTTYLAALFHLLRTQSPNAAGLGMAELPDGHEYLMEAESAWLRFEPFVRTVEESPGSLIVPLERDGERTQLAIPDLRGEDFEHVWEYGASSSALAETVDRSSGVLLFIRADAVRGPDPLAPEVEQITTGETFELGEWSAQSAPTQTKLCDILERLGLLDGDKPIALVVSAWDTASGAESPEAWVQRSVPLLYQALQANDLRFKVFAVSAQGGDLGDPTAVAAMSRIDPAARVSDPDQRTGDDLTAPLAWLLEG